ncbi:hypothetical protein J4558_17040 [Leptolyngbya sp. 15MV]|nr:hypothetical protein J4558_17040 [Leptolyngbya sp. 15MV]
MAVVFNAPAITPSAGDIVSLAFQNAGTGALAGGVATFGQVFQAGDLPAGAELVARIGGADVPLQLDAIPFFWGVSKS